FVQRAKAPRHVNETETVFHKTNFARKKIMEMDRNVGKWIGELLSRQFDIEADGFAAGFRRTFVRRFHDARAAAGDDGEIMLREFFADGCRGAIIFVAGLRSR